MSESSMMVTTWVSTCTWCAFRLPALSFREGVGWARLKWGRDKTEYSESVVDGEVHLTLPSWTISSQSAVASRAWKQLPLLWSWGCHLGVEGDDTSFPPVSAEGDDTTWPRPGVGGDKLLAIFPIFDNRLRELIRKLLMIFVIAFLSKLTPCVLFITDSAMKLK
jgi:hypothetical protein